MGKDTATEPSAPTDNGVGGVARVRQRPALPGGGHTIDDHDVLDDIVPPSVELETSSCPVADQCAGCGGQDGLGAVTAAIPNATGYDVACAPLCASCDGRSFRHLHTSRT